MDNDEEESTRSEFLGFFVFKLKCTRTKLAFTKNQYKFYLRSESNETYYPLRMRFDLNLILVPRICLNFLDLEGTESGENSSDWMQQFAEILSKMVSVNCIGER